MKAEIYPIADVPFGRLAIMPRPRAGDWLEDEIASWRSSGLNVIVSLLQPGEVAELELEQEEALCQQAGLSFIRFPLADRGVPESRVEVTNLIGSLVEHLRQGRGVGIHCRIGVGRSALIAACVLVALGRSLESAWSAIENARRLSVPDTPQQRAWVIAWAAEDSGHTG
jgi:protein-tyrosine phosphatase